MLKRIKLKKCKYKWESHEVFSSSSRVKAKRDVPWAQFLSDWISPHERVHPLPIYFVEEVENKRLKFPTPSSLGNLTRIGIGPETPVQGWQTRWFRELFKYANVFMPLLHPSPLLTFKDLKHFQENCTPSSHQFYLDRRHHFAKTFGHIP